MMDEQLVLRKPTRESSTLHFRLRAAGLGNSDKAAEKISAGFSKEYLKKIIKSTNYLPGLSDERWARYLTCLDKQFSKQELEDLLKYSDKKLHVFLSGMTLAFTISKNYPVVFEAIQSVKRGEVRSLVDEAEVGRFTPARPK